MPQSLIQKTVNNFVKGLITEAAELTFPESASVNESNCDLRRDGSRRRREAVAVESNAVLSSFTISNSEIVGTGTWINVGGNAALEFLVVQKGNTIFFYNKAELPYSDQVISGSISLATYEFAGSIGSNNVKCQYASINGTLIISSGAIDTIVASYDGTNVSVSSIAFKTRDFEWQGDTDTYPEEAASDAIRLYDTTNAGWTGDKGDAALTAYKAASSNQLPPLTHPWYAGKDSDNAFDAAEWKLIFAGTTLTGNGHFILDFFSKVRTGITTETESSRFKSVASFSGRVFYAGLTSAKNAGTILFSRLVEDNADLGKCHQQNDPTSEYLSDLLATDGGFINIPDAVNIQLLYSFRASLFVFAENGVWQVTGVDGIFSATAYGINRVSNIGILNPQTFIEADGLPFWWSRFGIHTLAVDEVSGQGSEQNITLPTIQTFWDKISTGAKSKITSVYDNINKKVYWAYPDNDETVEAKLNNILILDLTLQAFYPWKISDQTSSTSCVVGCAFYSGFGAAELELDVITAAGDDVVQGTDDIISTQVSDFNTGDPALVLLVRDGATNKLTMATFAGDTFLDWGEANYSSFAESGYDFGGDLIIKKNAPYIAVYSRLTETGFTGSEDAGYESIRPSSLLVSSAWDFNENFNTAQQAYRLKFPVLVDSGNITNFNYPEDVITTRLKVRGHGRSVRLRYESEQGKDFILLGWGLIFGRNQRF
tara:strand:+ start:994 stop:3132 length:2139 start_codon:yes stop_codon:yes gene_type:complete